MSDDTRNLNSAILKLGRAEGTIGTVDDEDEYRDALDDLDAIPKSELRELVEKARRNSDYVMDDHECVRWTRFADELEELL